MIPFHQPDIGLEEVSNITKVLKSRWLTYGDQCRQFEERIKEVTGYHHCVVTNSATAGLLITVKLLKKDETVVQTSDNTFIATPNSIELNGLTTKLIDIDARTLNMKTGVGSTIIVSYGGNRCSDPRKKGGFVIEDSAHAFRRKQDGCRRADATIFSFYSTKQLSTGTGGAICWDSKLDEEQVRSLCNHGLSTSSIDRYKTMNIDYDSKEVGYNFLMSDLQAALGLAQIKKIDENNRKRVNIAKRYKKAFKHMYHITMPTMYMRRNKIFHLFPIFSKDKEKLMKHLNDNDIGYSCHFKPIHRFTYYKNKYNLTDQDYPMSSYVYDKLISLPIYPGMTDEQVSTVIEVISTLEE